MLFFVVCDLATAVEVVGPERVVASDLDPSKGRGLWAILRDPEEHNVILFEADRRERPVMDRAEE